MKRRNFLLASSGAAALAATAFNPTGATPAVADPWRTETSGDEPLIRTASDKRIAVPMLPAAPDFSGDLEGGTWADAAVLDRFHRCYTLAVADPSATARLGWRDDRLFVGVRIPAADRNAVTTLTLLVKTAPGDSRYAVVEAPLAPTRITLAREWAEDWRPDRNWSRSHLATVTPQQHDHPSGDLVVEFAVPFADIGVTGDPSGQWRFTIVLLTEMGSRPVTAWVPIRYAHYQESDAAQMGQPALFRANVVGHDAWGTIDFDDDGLSHFSPVDPELRWLDHTTKRLALVVPDTNGSPRSRRVLSGRLSATVRWIEPGGTATTVADNVAVTGSQVTVEFSHPAPITDGRYRLRIDLSGPAGLTTTAELSFDHHDLVDAGIARVGRQFPAPVTETVEPEPPSQRVADLIALLPDQFGVAHIGNPDDPAERPQFANWRLSDDQQHIVHRISGKEFPRAEYPEDKETSARNVDGEVVTYPYHEDTEGRRYFFTAALWNHQTRYVRDAIPELLVSDPLGAARVLVALAQKARGYAMRSNVEWNTYLCDVPSGPPYNFRGGYWSVWTPEELNHLDVVVQAWTALAPTNAFDLLSAEQGIDVREMIRRDLVQPPLDHVLSGPILMHNTDPYVWRRIFMLGVSFCEPDLVHKVLSWMDDFMASQFLHDGFWKEITPAYHAQVVINIAQLISAFAGYSDPTGYESPRSGSRVDDLDLTGRYPQLVGQQKLPDILTYANNRQVPIQDTWASQVRAADPSAGPLVLPAAGLVRLTGPAQDEQMQAYVMATAKYGHNHSDPLNLTLHAHGQELLPDIGYTYTKYRRFVSSTIGHNTVLVDGADMYYFARAHHGGRIERMVVTDDHQIVRASFPDAYRGTSVYARETWLIPRSSGGCHVLDIFRVVGGQRHELVLHGDADHDADFTVDVDTAPYGPYLLPEGTPVRPPVDYRDFGEAGGHYPGYQYIRDVTRADLAGSDAYRMDLTTTAADGSSLAGLRVRGLLDSGHHELFLGRSPSLRTTRAHGAAVQYDNNIEADRYDKPSHVLRREGTDLRSTFVTVLEPYDGPEPEIEVTERRPIETGSQDAVAVMIIHDLVTDLLLSNPDPATPLVTGSTTLNGEFGHVRWVDGVLTMMRVAGGSGSLVVDETESAGPRTWQSTLTQTTRIAGGDDANTLKVDAGIPFDPTGCHATVTHPDGSTTTMKVVSASTLDGGVTLDLGDMDPGVVIDSDGSSRQPYFPMKSWTEGDHRVTIIAPSVSSPNLPVAETPVGTVEGTVRSATGEPMEGVEVHLTGRSTPVTTTDGDGTFVLTEVGEGGQHVTARLAGYSTAVSPTLDVPAGGSTSVELVMTDHELPPELIDVTRYAVPGEPVSVTSSLPATVHLVPADTPREVDAIRSAGGSSAVVSAPGVPVELATTGLESGTWTAYAIERHDRVSVASPVLLVARGSRTVDDAGDEVVYTGQWSHLTSELHWAGTFSYTNERGGSVTVPFHGTRAVVKSHINDAGGMADVYLDDRLVAEIDYYAPEIERQVVVYDTGTLPAGLHTVRVVSRAEVSPGNPGRQYQVRFDSAVITD